LLAYYVESCVMDWTVDQISSTPRWTEKKLSLQLRNCAVHPNKLIIRNSRTWFYEGEIDLHSQVVNENVTQAKPVDFCHPIAFPFRRVADRRVSASFNPAQTISKQASIRCPKVKDLSFTQELRTQ